MICLQVNSHLRASESRTLTEPKLCTFALIVRLARHDAVDICITNDDPI